jgi:predicted adenylyl cyclase CyaB
MRNIELKARLADLEAARRMARSIATKAIGSRHQIDTYFRCHNGRLKLRQADHMPAELIWYARPDEPGSKASDYRLVPVANPETLKTALSAALGVWTVVEKLREILLWRNVRIHLDQVAGLGNFIEFEAVLKTEQDDSVGHKQLEELRNTFAIDPSDCVSGSYSDLLSGDG